MIKKQTNQQTIANARDATRNNCELFCIRQHVVIPWVFWK